MKIVDFGFARAKPVSTKTTTINTRTTLKRGMNAAATATTTATSTGNSDSMMQTPCFTLSYAAPEVLRQALLTTTVLTTNATATGAAAPVSASTSTSNQSIDSRFEGNDLTAAQQGYDESCDLWSLGVILYTILCGAVPFTNKSSRSADRYTHLEPNIFPLRKDYKEAWFGIS